MSCADRRTSVTRAMTDAGFYQVYGATEAAGVATVLDSADHRAPIDDRHLSSAGRPLAGIEAAIDTSTAGQTVTAGEVGEVGEVLLRGEQVMAGYWKQPAITTAARFCRGQLSGYKCPKSLDFASTLPRNGTGKILKRELREEYRRSAAG